MGGVGQAEKREKKTRRKESGEDKVRPRPEIPIISHQELVSESDVSENSKFIKPELRENSGLYISDRVLNQTADTGVIPAFQGE